MEFESLLRTFRLKVDITTSEWMTKVVLQRKLSSDILDELYAHQHNTILTVQDITEGLHSIINKRRANEEVKASCKPSEIENKSQLKGKTTTPNKHQSITQTSICRKSDNAAASSKPTVTSSPKPVTSKRAVGWGTCMFCKKKHSTYHCANYPTRDTRIERLQELGRCARCLKSHNIDYCDTQFNTCNRCRRGRHHAALCKYTKLTYSRPKVEDSIPTTVQYCKVQQTKSVQSAKSKGNTTLPTAQITILNKRAKVHTRGLFDQGSQRTYITKKLADELQLRPVAQMSFNISGFVTDAGPQVYQVVQPSVRLGRYVCRVQAIVVDKIPVDLQVQGLRATAKFLRNRGIKLADNIKSDHLTDFGLLVGTDYCHRFIGSPTKYQGITMLNSAGGKLLSGPVSSLRRPMPADKQYQ
ncbi:uncharacterized protein [Procambarus clarkii]|uniref:uncharacterized protein n=1 Tax=Procambarus clarkii TaxID=6728 RepID=UPI003744041D